MRVFRNLSKAQILEQFESLQRESKHFNETTEGGEVLTIMVRWIGASITLNDERAISFTSEFGEHCFDRCAVTFDGQMVNM